ncbi:hypothetical protein Ancab_000036 [Ancistrocladus abbreviatus]
MGPKPSGLLVLIMMIMTVVEFASADDQLTKDKQECAPQLGVLAPCLSYVSGNGDAKTPTPDCCAGLKQVLKSSKRCLCLLVKYKDDPSLGLKINTTAALSLPTVCHAPANVSECPALLHLPPNSPDAKVFDDFAKGATGNSPPAATSNSTGGGSTGSAAAVRGLAGKGRRRLEACQMVYMAFSVILWFITC